MLIIFLATYIALKVKSPTLPGTEEEDHKKFKLLFIIFTFVGVIQLGFDVLLRYNDLNKVDDSMVMSIFPAIVNYIVAPSFFI